MRSDRTRRATLLAITGLLAFTRAHGGDDAADLLARGACTAATGAAAAALATAERSGDGVADALATSSRVALECQHGGAALDDALARELQLRVASDGADSAAAATVRLQQARAAMQAGRTDDALAIARALDERAESQHWPTALRARIAFRLASVHNVRADAPAAFAASTRAIDLARAAHDDGTLMLALRDRGFAFVRQRRGADALEPIGEAERIARATYGDHSRELADILRTKAKAQRDAGDHGGAIDALEQALAIQRAQVEPDARDIAATLLNLGQTLKIAGDMERAAKVYAEALDADRRGPDPSGRTRPALLHGLANLERDSGRNERALPLYAEAESLAAGSYGAQSVQLAQILNNHANAEGNLKRYDAATALYRRAIDIARARGSTDPGDYLPLANLAMIEVGRGRYVEAETGFREMLVHLQHVGAGSEASTVFSDMGLAASLWGQRRLDEAFDVAARAERNRQAALRLAASHLGEREAVNLQEVLRPSMDLVVAIAVDSGNPRLLERAWELGMAARDQITAVRAQRLASARRTNDPRLTALWQDWRAASAALAQEELAHPGATGYGEAQARLDRAERALARATPLGAALAAAPLGMRELRANLPAGDSLVLFTTSRQRGASDFAKDDAERRTPDLYALLLPAADAPVRAVRLGPLDAVERRLDAWTAALADRDVALATVEQRGRALRQSVWQPLVDAGAGQRWLVLPTDALFRIAWTALPDGDGYLADRGARVHALNHERELLAAPAAAATPRLLAIADPAATARLPATSRRCAEARVALPGARRESASLDALWRARFGESAPSRVLSGTDATEARLRDAVAQADIVHFGTHGLSLDEDCSVTASAPMLATRGFTLAADTPIDASTPVLAPAALLLAAGGGEGNDDDGVLTAEEIAALDLSHTRWAVLAACATAAGSTHRYEGLFGLARAFRLAGARTVLTSLWPVDDAATAEWTRALYAARIERGLDTAASLADAQRSVLAARRARGDSTHPYYWAAFTASGDWR